MANYWLKRSPAAQLEGPFTGTQLKQMAARGQIAATALLSADQAKWTTAEKVKGLFPERSIPAPARPAALAPATVVAPASNEADTYDVADEPAPVQPVLATAAPVVAQPLAYSSNELPQPRNVQWVVVCASIILTLGITSRILDFTYNAGSSFSRSFTSMQRNSTPRFGSRAATPAVDTPNIVVLIFAAVLSLGILIGSVGLYIYFTVWAYIAHRDMQQFTRGAYPIGPARACGFCWIPLFHLFWLVYMPYKLSEAVEWHLGPGRPIVKPKNVMAMQIGSIVAGCCVAGLPIYLIASSIKQIQTGLNALWLNPIQVPGRGW
jgi:hypothetical protein